MIEKTRSGPKGVGKGGGNKSALDNINEEDMDPDELYRLKEAKKRAQKNKYNNIGTHLERARLCNDEEN